MPAVRRWFAKQACRTKTEPGSHSTDIDKTAERFFLLRRYSPQRSEPERSCDLTDKLSFGVTRRLVRVDLDRRLIWAAVFLCPSDCASIKPRCVT
jgi:hypothetical protein